MQGRERDRDVENRCVDKRGGEGEGGTTWESDIDVYTLPRVKQTAVGALTYSTRGSARRSVGTLRDGMGVWKAGPRGRGHMYIYG